MKNVFVVFAAYNGGEFIKEQFDSISFQTDVDVRVYFSVDISNDGTLNIIRDCSLDSYSILLPYGERFGGAAPNFYRLISDVDFSNCDYVAFADQDDIWHPDKLSNACKILEEGEYDVYSSNVTAFWADGREELIDKAQPQRELDFFFEAAGPGCTYVFKRDVMLELQKFVRGLPKDVRKNVLHDWLSYAFCRTRGYKWYIDPNPSMRYRQHDNNQVGTNNNFKAYKKRFSMIFNKTYRKQVEALVSVVAPEQLNNISNRLYLIKNFRQLRRRARDRYFLLIMLLLGIY